MDETPPSGVEIERKFLVDRLPDGLGEGDRIEQGYLAIGDDGVEVRVRRRGDDMTLTIKSGLAQSAARSSTSTSAASTRYAAERASPHRHDAPSRQPGEGLTGELDV